MTTYSTRFIDAYGQSVFTAYDVPPGYRVVVTCFIAQNTGPAGEFAILCIDATAVLYSRMLAQQEGEVHNLRLVVNGGETLMVYTTHNSLRAWVSGFLFADEGVPLGAPTPQVQLQRYYDPGPALELPSDALEEISQSRPEADDAVQ